MASIEVPQTMKALVTQGKGSVAVQQRPVPSIDDDEILVKVVAAAQNPTDYKSIDGIGKPGTICGVDWAGIVIKLGKSFALGDSIAGFTHGGAYEDRGAYAEYVKASSDLAWKIPEGTLSFEQAATMGCAFWTAAMGLFNPKHLGLVEPPTKVAKDEWTFVYGGSSSLGMYTIQLAHLAGYKVVTVASPRNWDICKTLGADSVFDYKDPEAITKIKAATDDTLQYAFDAISSTESAKLCVQALASGPGQVITVLPVTDEVHSVREDVDVTHILVYTTLGRAFARQGGQLYPAAPDDRAHMAQFLRKVPDWVRAGAVKPNPVKLWEGGLEAVTDGLQYMREGKASAEKIVYRIS